MPSLSIYYDASSHCFAYGLSPAILASQATILDLFCYKGPLELTHPPQNTSNMYKYTPQPESPLSKPCVHLPQWNLLFFKSYAASWKVYSRGPTAEIRTANSARAGLTGSLTYLCKGLVLAALYSKLLFLLFYAQVTLASNISARFPFPSSIQDPNRLIYCRTRLGIKLLSVVPTGVQTAFTTILARRSTCINSTQNEPAATPANPQLPTSHISSPRGQNSPHHRQRRPYSSSYSLFPPI